MIFTPVDVRCVCVKALPPISSRAMAIETTLHNGVVRTVMSGTVTTADVCDHLTTLRDDARIPAVFIEVIDLSSVTDLDIHSQDANLISAVSVALHARHDESHIIVLAPEALTYGVARMIQAYVSTRVPDTNWYIEKKPEAIPKILAGLGVSN